MSIFALFLLLASGAAAPIDNAPSTATFPRRLVLDRVRYRDCVAPAPRNVSACPTALSRPQYAVFGAAGVTSADQEALLLAEASRPAPARVRNLALFIGGQQRRGAGMGVKDGLTGKPDGFRPPATTASRPLRLPRGALARKLFAASGFKLRDTFTAVVFAPAFDFTLSPALKPDYIDAYERYLLAALPPGRAPRSVLLAGHSRGGCLALLLAQRLAVRFPRAGMTVTAVDAVCVPDAPQLPAGSAELGATVVPRRNPLRAGLWVYTADVKRAFARRYCLFVDAYITGRGVIVPEVRPLGYSGFGGSTRRRNYLQRWRGQLKRVFYRETWTTETHTGVSFENHGSAVHWLKRGMRDNRRFRCTHG